MQQNINFFFCFRVKELTENVNAEVAIKEELTSSIKAKDEEIEVRLVYSLSFLCKLSLIFHYLTNSLTAEKIK